jgi:hypothetical protein
MRRFLRAFWSLFWVVLALASVVGVYNVLRDDFDVYSLAQAAACEGQGATCTVQRYYTDRGPFGETYELVDDKREIVRIRCTRSQLLLGDYACEVRDRRPYAGPLTTVILPAPAAKSKAGGARKPGPSAPASGSAPAPSSPGDGGL